MNIELSENTIQNATDYLKIDIEVYINTFTQFINTDLVNFINYYQGKDNQLNTISKANFDSLWLQCELVNETIKQNSHNLIGNDFANMIEMLDEIRIRLKMIFVLGRFLKSSIVNTSHSNSITVDRKVASFESPESVHSDTNSPQNDWVGTFVKNRIYETDYEENNGFLISKELTNFQNFNVNTVVDNLIMDNLQGKDLDKNITYDFDTDDFKVLGFDDTLLQATTITANAIYGDHGLYPDFGIDPVNLQGSAMGFNLEFIIRDLIKNFSIDDTIQDFSITDIKINLGRIDLAMECKSITNKIINQNLILQAR